MLDPDVPALELVALYHERWEIETGFAELKSTSLGGRVLRSRTPTGIAQEIYALLITYQVLRIAISDATLARPDVDPDRGSFTVARTPLATNSSPPPVSSPTPSIDLVGTIGRHVLDQLCRPGGPHQPTRGQTRDLQIRRQQRQESPPRTQPPRDDQHRDTTDLDSTAAGLTERLRRYLLSI